MQPILDVFNIVAFSAFGVPVTLLELFGFITGGLCVFAVAKQYTWNWPVAILNAIAFAFLFFGVGLYADAFLQIIFLVLSIYGWYYWVKGRKVTDTVKAPAIVRNGTKREYLLLGAIGLVAWFLFGWFLKTHTDSTVYEFDSFILIASIVATYFQAKKVIQSWYVWIAVDLISVPLYFYKGLALTGLLYIIFLGICVYGLIDWKRDLKAQAVNADHPSRGEKIVAHIDSRIEARKDEK
jgi:nicotinamide mononucleotide transporter